MSSRLLDRSAALLVQGYRFLPRLLQDADAAEVRLLGQRALCVRGPEAAEFLYDDAVFERRSALSSPVLDTLLGRGAVHTLDGPAHRHRKAMIMSVTADPGAISAVVQRAEREWDAAVDRWTPQVPAVLFREASQVLTRAVCAWGGVPLAEEEASARADDLVAMVDGFGSAGARHWRARRARARSEQWIARLVVEARLGRIDPPQGSPLRVVVEHEDLDGVPLDEHVAAVDLLNILRPTVAVAWFVAFAGHAMHVHPHIRDRVLQDGDPYREAFAHELRRFYPFAPFVGARAHRLATWQGHEVREGDLVLLDIFGQHHDARFWPEPYTFVPERFLSRAIGPFDLLPQGGGDPAVAHRCAGERLTIELVKAMARRLATLTYEVPPQDLRIPLRPIPTRPRDGVLLSPMPARSSKMTAREDR